MNKAQEKIMDDIYQSLKDMYIEEKVNPQNKAFIADFLSQKLYKLGYHKLPEGKPSLLSDEEVVQKMKEAGWGRSTIEFRTPLDERDIQRDSDIEFYKGGE